MIHFEDVHYHYPHQAHPALQGINLHIRPGRAVLITGGSGCGKSTLGRLINGLIPSYFGGTLSGRCQIDQKACCQHSFQDRTRLVGSLFQDPEQQFLSTRVDDEVRTALEWRGDSADDIERKLAPVMARLGIENKSHSSLFTLSEGEKQKVALASILTLAPKILMLDEPTANLDPQASRDLLHILQGLKRDGMTLVIFDHRLYWLRDLVDQVYLMDDGHISAPLSFAELETHRDRYGLRALDDPDTSPPDLLIQSQMERHGLFFSRISFGYDRQPPLFTEFSAGLARGRVVALCGPNGRGKTTLARLAMGLEKPKSGDILLAGQPATAKQRLRHSSLVLQNTELQLYMRSVHEELTGGQPSSTAPVEEILAQFHLHGLEQRHPQSLSGGQRQRLVIACALQKKPDILILDEPTSGLDGRNMRRLGQRIREEAERGCAVMLITHDMELVNNCCDAVWRL